MSPTTTTGSAPRTLTREEAGAIAADAYTYFYPLLSMDITRKQSTNAELGKEFGKGPANVFVNVVEYPPADYKGVVRSNFDTLYSTAWLDLTKEPLVISVPDTDGRFYLLPMLDMWTDVFASPGWRTTGTEARNFLVTPPSWKGALPAGMDHFPAPTPFVWVIGRTQTNGPPDYDSVHEIQQGLKITPLSHWGRSSQAVTVIVDPTVDMETPPREIVESMQGEEYFRYATALMGLHPPHITDQPIVARMRRLGIVPGLTFDINTLDPEVREAVRAAPEAALQLMQWKLATMARVANGWSMNTDTMGVYGNYYLKRAIIAQVGLGANVPEDAIYPLNIADAMGRPLDGAHHYRVHFANEALPPTDAFWSLTLYDSDGFPVSNDLNRFAMSSWMPFTFNGDGSLDLHIQNENPGKEHETNWLPAPTGPFNLTMRLYAPRFEALIGKWNPPPVKRMP